MSHRRSNIPRQVAKLTRKAAAGRLLWGLALLVLLVAGVAPVGAAQAVRSEGHRTGAISAAEFSRLIQNLSEEEGYFFSDNFVSNETAYLHVVDKLKELGVSGGAYLGVGPEQNFTYITKVRPEIAFIVDIRRQAMIQHLLYKAIFHMSATRVQFLARLFSKPVKETQAPRREASIEEILAYFAQTPTSPEAYRANLALIQRTIEKDFHFPLSRRDQRMLQYVYGAFQLAHMNISFRMGDRNFMSFYWGGFPTLRDLVLSTDLNGKQGNFLIREADYEFLRKLHRQNRVIPVVGDFAGPKALAAVGDYLRHNGYTVSAFYTSNVEQFLFGGEVFDAFTRNVRQLPINRSSVIIRSVRSRWEPHPAQVPGHRMITLLQTIAVFLKDYDEGLYPDYWRMVTTHYIAPNEP